MNTKQLRQKILDLAIRGQLVPQDSNDEPASVLLEKIRAEKQTLIEQKKIKKDKKFSYITCDLSPYQKYTEHFADGSSKDITDEIPFDIPENWAWSRLGEIAFYKKGPFGSSITKAMFVPKSNNTYKVYEQKNAINKNAFIGNYYISKEKFDELKGFEVFPNDIIVSCAGTIGETFILPEGIERGIINQALMRIMVYKRQIIPFYLIYFDSVLKNEANQQGKGIAIKNIPSFDVLKNFLIPLPPLSEQRRIVGKIEELLALVDDLEANKTDLQSYIKQAKSKVLEMAVRGELVPQNPNDEPASVLLERFKKEKLSQKSKGKTTEHNTHYEEELPFNIPENWVWCRFGEITKIIQYGVSKSAKSEGLYRLLRITDIQYNKVIWENVPFTDIKEKEAENFILENGDFLFARTGATVGKSYLVEDLVEKSVFASYLIRISLLPNNNINYIKYFFNSEFYWQQISEKSIGIGQPNVNGTSLKKLFLPLPPLAEQHRIVEKIEHIFAVLEELEENIL